MSFDINIWLEQLNLSEYIAIFEDEGIDEETLTDLTSDDLKDIGISKLGHRKKILKAIAALSDNKVKHSTLSESATTDHDNILSNLVHNLPRIIALPLQEYLQENHPTMKLWAACDTVELLLRFLMAIMVADRQQHGALDNKTLKEIWGKIEMPTLGAWLVMARTLAQNKTSGTLTVPQANDFIIKSLSPLLYGPSKPGTVQTSLLALRNRLAHGGGMTRKEAEQLLSIWQVPFEQTMQTLTWLTEVELVGLNEDNILQTLTGIDNDRIIEHTPLLNETINNLNQDAHQGIVWLMCDQQLLPLWPLTLYSKPVAPDPGTQQEKIGAQAAAQVYVRKDILRLQYSPMGAEGFSHSEAGGDILKAFENLFQLDKSHHQQNKKSFKVLDFDREIRRDANQLVGRTDEINYLKQQLSEHPQKVFWLTGPAGIGKSFLVARIAADLTDENLTPEQRIILAYRFRAGDDARCHRDAFSHFVSERLQAAGFIREGITIKDNAKAEERLETILGNVLPDKQVVLVVDGLDELLSRDNSFAEDIPLKLYYPNLTWLCAGRSEPTLTKAFHIGQAIEPFPDGLPPMSLADIRCMLLEKIGPLRKKLLAQDKDNNEAVVNPFIELVANRAEGLPLYVKYVIGDVLSGKYRVLDAHEDLPDSLHAYHEELLRRLGIGDLQSILTPLAATLAVAKEPLAIHEIQTFLTLRQLLPQDPTTGLKLLDKALSAIATMLRSASDPEGEEGFTLFHKSLRDHILSTDSMKVNVETSQQAFAQAALTPEQQDNIANYLYRAGIEHLLEAGLIQEARSLLLNLNHLGKMFELGVEHLEILQYWHQLDADSGKPYLDAVKSFITTDIDEQSLKTLRKLIGFMKTAGWYSSGADIAKLSQTLHEQILGKENEETLISIDLLSGLLYCKGNYDSAESLIRQVLEARQRLLRKEHPDTLSSLNDLAQLLYVKGDLDSAESLIRQVLEARQRLLGEEHPKTLNSLSFLGAFFKSRGDLGNAETLNNKVLKARKQLLGTEHPDTLSSLNNLAVLHHDKGNLDAAESLYQQIIEIRQRLLGAEHPDTLNSLNKLASLLRNKGNLDKAEELLRQVVEIRQHLLGAEHPDTLDSMSNLALLYHDKGDFDSAESLYRQVLESRKCLLGTEHPDTLRILNNLAALLQDKGDLDAAESLYRQIIEMQQRLLGTEHPNSLICLNNLATLINNKGDLESAEPLYRQIMDIRQRLLGTEHTDTLDSMSNLALLLHDKGDFDNATPLYLQVNETRQRLFGSEHPSTLESLNNLVLLYYDKGDLDNAKLLCHQMLETQEHLLGHDHPDTIESKNFLESLELLTEHEKILKEINSSLNDT